MLPIRVLGCPICDAEPGTEPKLPPSLRGEQHALSVDVQTNRVYLVTVFAGEPLPEQDPLTPEAADVLQRACQAPSLFVTLPEKHR